MPDTIESVNAINIEVPEEESTVTVLHGYGRISPTERHWVDTTLFVGGVARHVPFSVAKAWKTKAVLGRGIHILSDDATEADYARISGIQPMATPKFAAMLSAIDVDKLADELGPVRSRELAEKLNAHAEGKVIRDSQGKWRAKNTAKSELA